MSKTPVQKGPIEAHQPTMKSMTRNETNMQDAEMARLRRDGQTLKLHTPNKK